MSIWTVSLKRRGGKSDCAWRFTACFTLARMRFPTVPMKKMLLLVVMLLLTGTATYGKSHSLPEEIEWTWEVRPAHADPSLPNVLLLGDSISRDYFPRVTKLLAGTANVYLMAVSTSIGDPRIGEQIQEFAAMEGVRFRVVHLNNGLHGWEYTEVQYEAAFPSYLHTASKLIDKGGSLIWASITPVRSDTPNGASNARINVRNAIARRIVQREEMFIDDQHQLMMAHQDLHADAAHFTPAGAALQGDQVVECIRAALSRSK